MEWVPIIFVTFKLAAFGTCMFFAIKSHHDRARQKERESGKSKIPPDNTTEPSH